MPDGLISQQARVTITIGKTMGGLLFVIGVLATALSLLGTGGVFLYKGVLQKQLDDPANGLKKQVSDLEDKLRTSGVNQQMLDLDKKLTSARQVLAGHVVSSNVLDLLEENTLTQVRFSSFAFAAPPRQVDLTGEAAGYETLAQQVRVFESLPDVDAVSFGGLQLGEKGLLSFKMSIVVNPALLLWRGQ